VSTRSKRGAGRARRSRQGQIASHLHYEAREEQSAASREREEGGPKTRRHLPLKGVTIPILESEGTGELFRGAGPTGGRGYQHQASGAGTQEQGR